MGYVNGGGQYSQGQPCTLTAIPYNGFRFDHWQDNNTQNPRTITVTGNASYIAYFVITEDLDEINEDSILIFQQSGQIVVNGTIEKVQIFDIAGRNVRNEDLPEGIYIVKIGNHLAKKVVVSKWM